MADTGITTSALFNPQDEAAKPDVGLESLVRRIAAGERGAFNEFYARFAGMVNGIVLMRVPPDDAEDVVQEVFLAAFERIGSLRCADALGGWLATMARNKALDYLRRTSPTEPLPDDLETPGVLPARAIEALNVLRHMPPAYSEPLTMRLVEGLSGPEISARTGLKPESVRVNLSRGMKMLRERLSVGGQTKDRS